MSTGDRLIHGIHVDSLGLRRETRVGDNMYKTYKLSMNNVIQRCITQTTRVRSWKVIASSDAWQIHFLYQQMTRYRLSLLCPCGPRWIWQSPKYNWTLVSFNASCYSWLLNIDGGHDPVSIIYNDMAIFISLIWVTLMMRLWHIKKFHIIHIYHLPYCVLIRLPRNKLRDL